MKPPNALTAMEAADLLKLLQNAVDQARVEDPGAVALWWAGRSQWKTLNLSVDVRTGEVLLTDRLGNAALVADILDWMYTEAPNHPTKPLPETFFE